MIFVCVCTFYDGLVIYDFSPLFMMISLFVIFSLTFYDDLVAYDFLLFSTVYGDLVVFI